MIPGEQGLLAGADRRSDATVYSSDEIRALLVLGDEGCPQDGFSGSSDELRQSRRLEEESRRRLNEGIRGGDQTS